MTDIESMDIPSIEGKIKYLLSQMTLEEKLELIHGRGSFRTGEVARLGITALKMSDGPMGVRQEFVDNGWEAVFDTDDFATYLPSNVALTATWNTNLAYETGKVLGAEARGRGKDMILAPGINIMRTPLCGRNFEYMSEDPYLIAKMAVPFIKGIQENDVAACVKHFALNNQETNRLGVSTEVDERTLREIYLPGFEASIKEAGSYAIMSAYNQYQGEFCSHSKYLLDDILKEEWGYEGVVISDWGAVHDTYKAATCGLDIEMRVENNYDEFYLANPLLEAINKGEIKEEVVDEKVKRILRLMFKINKFEKNRKKGTYNHQGHREKALDAARESIVLLKNEELLPLNERALRRIVVIGENAERQHAKGGGSAEVKALYEITPLLGIKMYLGGNTEVVYAKGYSSKTGDNQEMLLTAALEAAKEADAVIYIGGLNHEFDTEERDKQDMKLPYGQDRVINELLKIRSDAVMIMISGSPVEMKEWSGKARAIIQGWYAGLEGGTALAEVIFGAVNPSGKLPVTFPKKLEDSPAHKLGEFPGDTNVYYNEGLFVGYRYFDTYKVMPEFAFGHGLSYTIYKFSDFEVVCNKEENGTLPKMRVQISLSLKNTGKREGAEVVQVYVAEVRTEEAARPHKVLKGFEKVKLLPGEIKKVRFLLNEEAFSHYDIEKSGWRCESRRVKIMVGTSSSDIRLDKEIQI